MNSKVAVVSGGTKGIGAAVVERLRKDGYAVVTGSRSAVPEQGEDLTVVRADLATAEGVETLAAAALERGRVDALVNNVGQFEARGSFLEVTDAQWEQGFAANVLSAVRLTRALLPALLPRGGAIVNVSSINARLPFPMVVDYSAHKAALTNLTTTLSEEFAPVECGSTRCRPDRSAHPAGRTTADWQTAWPPRPASHGSRCSPRACRQA